jgi:CheY-like chemotaxis protein
MPNREPGPRGGARLLRILVVDDTDHVRDMVAEMLEMDGFEITGRARGGDEAVAMAISDPPDAAVVDLRMPGIDGLETTRRLRAAMPELPVVLYTAYLDSAVERAAREAGAAACLTKLDGLRVLERELVRLTMEPGPLAGPPDAADGADGADGADAAAKPSGP